MKPLDVKTMNLPYLGSDIYKAVCCAVWHLNHQAPIASAVRKASEKHNIPMARIEKIIREALPPNYFYKRQRQSVKGNPIIAKTDAILMQHMSNL